MRIWTCFWLSNNMKGKLCSIAGEMWEFFKLDSVWSTRILQIDGSKAVITWVWDYNMPGTCWNHFASADHAITECRQFWRTRLMFWFFSQKLPDMFCSGLVSHGGVKSLLQMFHFSRTLCFQDPKMWEKQFEVQVQPNSHWKSNMYLCSLPFWLMWTVPRILALHLGVFKMPHLVPKLHF